MTKEKICSICGDLYTEFGNNAWPINSGRCCDECDDTIVIPARLTGMQSPEVVRDILNTIEEFYDALVKADKDHATKLLNDLFKMTKSNKVARRKEIFHE